MEEDEKEPEAQPLTTPAKSRMSVTLTVIKKEDKEKDDARQEQLSRNTAA